MFVVTPDEQLVKHCRSMFGQIGVLVKDLDSSLRDIVRETLSFGRKLVGVGHWGFAGFSGFGMFAAFPVTLLGDSLYSKIFWSF